MTDRERVMGLLEELAQDDWVLRFNDNDVKETAKAALALLKEQESTMNRLRSTMEDMVRGNASEEVSYLLRLLNKWEQGEVYASDSV